MWIHARTGNDAHRMGLDSVGRRVDRGHVRCVLAEAERDAGTTAERDREDSASDRSGRMN